MDLRFDPEPLVNALTRTPPQRARFYSSRATPGALTVVLRPEGDPFAPMSGLRLTREQTETLRDALTDHLKEYPA